MNEKTKFVSVALLGLALIVAGCSREQPQQEMPPTRVTVGKAQKQNPALVYRTFGNLVSPASVDLLSQVSGQISAVHFVEGDQVKAGDVLFSIDTDIYQAEVDSARAQVAQAQAQLKLDQITLERNKGLLAKKLISQQDFDTLTANLESSQAQLSLSQAQLNQAQINLGYCTISSPVSGRTGKRQVDPGNIVIADQGPTLVNIKQVDRLYIDFSVSETLFDELQARLAKGDMEVAIIPAGGEDSYQGKINFFNNSVDPDNASFAMRGVIDNPDGHLWPGQYVSVELSYGEIKDAIVVPANAVQLGQKGSYIFSVDSNNTAKLHNPVKLGPSIKEGVVIVNDIADGQTVVTSGQLGLRDGAKVSIVKDTKDQDSPTKSTSGGAS